MIRTGGTCRFLERGDGGGFILLMLLLELLDACALGCFLGVDALPAMF